MIMNSDVNFTEKFTRALTARFYKTKAKLDSNFALVL